MNRSLRKHILDYHKSIAYAKDQLSGGNALSNELISSLDFENGQFFTLLPIENDLKHIYDFFCGMIPQQYEFNKETKEIIGRDRYLSWIPKDVEIANLICAEISNKNNYACIFEDVQQDLTDSHIEFFYQFGCSYLNEMYYFVDKKNVSSEVILQGMSESDALWHHLFILTKVDYLNTPGQQVTLEDIRNFAKNTQLLILGAYDGDGYFFWEPEINLFL
ncbi:MAG: hypothetical protein H0U49_00800 [Parachlamydiaceae bacterium]|nr:hypothetical protein [Parachlamydiaceae bacterium]